jgi:hypothetical protein
MSHIRSLAVLGWVLVQLLLPARGLLSSKFDSRGNFSWNMYADVYGCHVLYSLTDATGRTIALPLQQYFNRPDQLHMILHGDVLPRFNEWLCAELQREGKTGRVRAEVRCRLNDAEERALVDELDVCAAPGTGVPAR